MWGVMQLLLHVRTVQYIKKFKKHYMSQLSKQTNKQTHLAPPPIIPIWAAITLWKYIAFQELDLVQLLYYVLLYTSIHNLKDTVLYVWN